MRELILTRENFRGQFAIAFSAGGFGFVFEHRQAMTRALGQADIARNDGFENFVGKMLPYLARDLMTEAVARIEHRQYEALDFEPGAQLLFDALDSREQRAESFER